MKVFFDKYKSIILPLVLLLVFALCTALTWGKWGHIIYDCFREAVIPQALLDGKVLYRDITNLYPPLAYQFNALLFLIFGNSLNTLYWAGIINSLIVLSIIYFLVKKYSNNLTAFIAVLSIMALLVFRVYPSTTTISWFFPYSYSFIYAFSACLLSLLSFVLYKENQKHLFLCLSFLFIGLSFAFKLDFVLFALIPFLEFIKRKSLRTFLIGAACFLSPFVISILIYLLTGGTIADLQNEVKFLADFAKTPSVILFNKSTMPQAFKPWVLKEAFDAFLRFVIISAIVSVYTLFSIFAVSKFKNVFLKCIAGFILFCAGYFTIIKTVATIQYPNSMLYADLVYVPYIVVTSAFVIFTLKFIKDKGIWGIKFSDNERFYFLITVCAFLISFRTFALVYAGCVGNFMLAIWWTAFIYLFLELVPKYFPNVFKKEIIRKTLCLFFVTYPLYFVFAYISNSSQMTYEITGNKGAFYGSAKFIPVINETIKFINEEIPKDKNFLAAEEGLVFNYLTERESNLKYYALIPHITDTFGEENIIDDLTKSPPDYFLITNNIYITEKLGGVFGIHYARKIAKFIVQNYDYVKTIKNQNIKDGLEITIFRLKKAENLSKR